MSEAVERVRAKIALAKNNGFPRMRFRVTTIEALLSELEQVTAREADWIKGQNELLARVAELEATAQTPRPGFVLVPEEPTEDVARCIWDFLNKRFPEGALPGGVQLFADPGDHTDAEMKHEAGCHALADTIIAMIAARPTLPVPVELGEG